MKRLTLTGVFATAVLLASPTFAAEDLCAANLTKIDNQMATAGASANADPMYKTVEEDKAKAMSAQASGDTKTCIALTTKILDDIEKSTKGDGNGAGQ